jgi:hypothetical protein
MPTTSLHFRVTPFGSLCTMALVAAGCALLGAVGCVAPQESTGSGSSTSDLTAQLEVATQASLPTCTAKTAGETAIVTSTDTLERCVAKTWTVIACTASIGGTVVYSSATNTLWACTNNPDGGSPEWRQIAVSPPAADAGGSDNWNNPGSGADAGSEDAGGSDTWNNPGSGDDAGAEDAGGSDNWNGPGVLAPLVRSAR